MSENLDRFNKDFFDSLSELIGLDFSDDSEVCSFFSERPRVSMLEISTRKHVTDSINDWLEELLSSSRNIEILAESSLGVIGKGDEDLRMREMALGEGASLKKYTEITEAIIRRKTVLNVS